MARSRVRWFAWVLALLCGWFGLRVAPSHHFQTEAAQWLRDDARQRQLARSVNAGLPRVSADSFTTGAALFDGEWAFGTGVMAALGNAQLALQSPGTRAWTLTATDRALTQATSWEIRAFDRERWGSDPIDEPDPARAHVAYLGYVNLALSLRSALGRSEHDALGEHLTQRLVDAYAASPALLLETYPGEHYPVDNAMAIASVALRGRVDELRGDHPARAAQRRALAKRWTRAARLRYVDPRSGLLLQHAPPTVQDEPSTGLPRGSGSALAAFALNYVDDELSAELQRALRKQLLDPVLGFGVLQEHPSNVPWRDRRSDIDSGPLLFGYSISASGFMVGASRAHGDDGSFVNLMATFDLLGGLGRREFPDGVRRSFVSGGPLADAIMLAMLTAPPHHDVGALLERASREAP